MLRLSSLSICLFVFASVPSFAANNLTVKAMPVWKLDLRHSGYVSDPYKVHSAPTAMRQLAFGNQHELVVINDGGICGKVNPVTAFVVDTSSGKLLKKTNWVANCWPYIFGTTAGHYAVVTNKGMALYSQGLSGIMTSNAEIAAERISPDGSVLGAWKQVPGKALNYLVNAETLRPTGIEVANKRVDSVSAHRFASVASRVGSPDHVVIVGDGKAQQLEYPTGCGQVQAQFLSSDVLAIFGCNTITVINVAGAELFSEKNVGYPGPSGVAAVSRNGKRFAIRQTIEKESGDGPDKITSERVTVFDITARKAVFVADIDRLHGLDSPAHASGIALSPDGTLLAADSEGFLQLFRVP